MSCRGDPRQELGSRSAATFHGRGQMNIQRSTRARARLGQVLFPDQVLSDWLLFARQQFPLFIVCVSVALRSSLLVGL